MWRSPGLSNWAIWPCRVRRRVLAQAADEHALLIPAHFPGAAAAEIRAQGSGFAVERWEFR